MTKKKINWFYWSAFVIATISITEFFTAYKFILANHTDQALLVIVLSLSVFVISLTFLAYQIYAGEKDQNNLRVSFKLFDFVYNKLKDKKYV